MGRDEPEVRNLPKVTSRTLLSGVSSLTHHYRKLAVLAHLQRKKV
jgi:hypothetical protein